MKKRTLAAGILFGMALMIEALVVLAQPFDESTSVALVDTASVCFAAVACLSALKASILASGAGRQGWSFIAAGIAAWFIGESCWAYYEIFLGRDAPFPSVADLAYLGGYPLLLAGVLRLAIPPRTVAWIRTMLDASILVGVAAAPTWHYLLHAIYVESEGSILNAALASGYPIADLVLLFGLAVAALRSWRKKTGVVLMTLAGGLTLFLAADFAFSVLSQQGTFQTGTVLDIAWLGGYAMTALASVLYCEWRPSLDHQDEARSAMTLRQALPLVLLLPLVCWMLYIFTTGASQSLVTGSIVATVVALAVCRSMLTLEDVVGLNRELDQAYRELQSANAQLHKQSQQLSGLLVEAVDQARRDTLTGLLNHVSILKELQNAIDDGASQILVAMVDVDYMKRVNDIGGHQAGDAVIVEAAKRLQRINHVTAGRYGGDEFICFLPGDTETIRSVIQALESETTISIPTLDSSVIRLIFIEPALFVAYRTTLRVSSETAVAIRL